MYKLVAIDLDGTLLRDDKTFSKYTIDIISKVCKKGVHIAIASGRPFPVVKNIIQDLGISDFDECCITLNGASIQKTNSGEVLYASSITGFDIREIYSLLTNTNCFMHAFSLSRGLLVNKYNDYSAIEHFGGLIKSNEFDFFLTPYDEFFFKAVVVGEKDQIDLIEKNIPKDFMNKYSIIRTLDNLLEFLKLGTHKGLGIDVLAKYYNISRDEIIAFGDEQNDFEMLSSVGMPIAMGNASDRIKSLCKYTTDTNNNDGVAKALKKLILDF